MGYPQLLRSVVGAVPVGVEVGARRGRVLLTLLDRVVDSRGDAYVDVGGVRLAVNLEHASERLLYYAPANLLRSYRNAELYRLMRGLPTRRGGLFVDVGANLGLFSLLARSLGLRTLLFEPEPAHLRFLRRNEGAIGPVVGSALSDEEGARELHVAGPTNPGGSSLVSSSGNRPLYASTATVEVTTFDAALARLRIAPGQVALVKIDVEGNEERTVRGMRDHLARSAAPVWCEVRGPASDRAPSSYRSVSELLAEHSYRPYRSVGGRPVPFEPAGRLPQVFDLLFLKDA